MKRTDGRTVVYHNTSRLKDGRITTIETKEVARIAGYSIQATSFFNSTTISPEQLTTERQGY